MYIQIACILIADNDKIILFAIGSKPTIYKNWTCDNFPNYERINITLSLFNILPSPLIRIVLTKIFFCYYNPTSRLNFYYIKEQLTKCLQCINGDYCCGGSRLNIVVNTNNTNIIIRNIVMNVLTIYELFKCSVWNKG